MTKDLCIQQVIFCVQNAILDFTISKWHYIRIVLFIVYIRTHICVHVRIIGILGLWANQTILDEADDWQNWAPKAFHYNPKRTDISQKLRQFYFGAQTKHLNSRDLIQNFTNLFGDRLFIVGVAQAALLERKFVPTYLYYYEHDGGFNLGTFLATSQAKIHPIVDLIAERLRYLYVTFLLGEEYRHDVPGLYIHTHYTFNKNMKFYGKKFYCHIIYAPSSGTAHYDEFAMLYSGPLEYMYMTSKDVKMSIEMVKLWVDFATDQ